METSRLAIVGRLGVPPGQQGSLGNDTCSDVFELNDGRFVIIGTDMTDEVDGILPTDAARAEYERIVVVSRETLIKAKPDIPDI